MDMLLELITHTKEERIRKRECVGKDNQNDKAETIDQASSHPWDGTLAESKNNVCTQKRAQGFENRNGPAYNVSYM